MPSCAELLGRVLHISEYAVLALLTARAMIWHADVRLASLVLVLGLTELYALSDEIHQLFVPGRTFQLMDLALDLLGGMIGLIFFERIRAKRRLL
jgi:VanZ family protein